MLNLNKVKLWSECKWKVFFFLYIHSQITIDFKKKTWKQNCSIKQKGEVQFPLNIYSKLLQTENYTWPKMFWKEKNIKKNP